MCEIGDVEQQLRLAGGIVLGFGVELGDLVIDAAHLRFDRGSVLTLALEHADLFGNRFARILELLLGSLRRTARLVTGKHVINELPEISTPGFKAFLNGGRVFADDADIEHGAAILAGDRADNQRESLLQASLSSVL